MLRMLNMRNNCRLAPSGGISLEPLTGSEGLQKTPEPVVAQLTPDETRTMLEPLGGCGPEHGGLDVLRADVAAPDDDVDVASLLPLTQLCVQTEYTAYRLTILDPAAATVMIQGGRRFADPTPARIEGATLGGRCFIVLGMRLEVWADGRRLLTSAVRSVEIDHPGPTVSRPASEAR